MDKKKILVPTLVLTLSILTYFFFTNKDKNDTELLTKSNPESSQKKQTYLDQANQEASVLNKFKGTQNSEEAFQEISEVNDDSIKPEPIELRKFEIVSLFKEFDQLKKMADDGDLDASFILGELLQTCSLQPKNRDEYDK